VGGGEPPRIAGDERQLWTCSPALKHALHQSALEVTQVQEKRFVWLSLAVERHQIEALSFIRSPQGK
jgi:hypothetical protein